MHCTAILELCGSRDNYTSWCFERIKKKGIVSLERQSILLVWIRPGVGSVCTTKIDDQNICQKNSDINVSNATHQDTVNKTAYTGTKVPSQTRTPFTHSENRKQGALKWQKKLLRIPRIVRQSDSRKDKCAQDCTAVVEIKAIHTGVIPRPHSISQSYREREWLISKAVLGMNLTLTCWP